MDSTAQIIKSHLKSLKRVKRTGMRMALTKGKKAYPFIAINQASVTANGLNISNKQYMNQIPHKTVNRLIPRFHS